MRIVCEICRREMEADPKRKKIAGRELCPECLFLARQRNQPAGPEKMILRILHEHLIRKKVAVENRFSVWRYQPDFRDGNCPPYWTESIFGDFLKCGYDVTYPVKDSPENAEKFGTALRGAFDESSGGSSVFEFDPGHLAFSVAGVCRVERQENIPGVAQYCCRVTF